MNPLAYYLMPHPPIIIPQVGKGEEKKIQQTIDACLKIGKEINDIKPETIIIITPHGPLFNDGIAISYEPEIKGDLTKFGAKNLKISKKIDLHLSSDIIELSKEKDIFAVPVTNGILKSYGRNFEIDHGTFIPLYFIDQFYQDYELVHITYGLLSDIELFTFGITIKEAIERLNRKAVIIASGDLSHRLTHDGPYPYSPKGAIFDEALLKYLVNGNIVELFNMNKALIQEAGECGYRSIEILLGSLSGHKWVGDLMSYEGIFGVGYGVIKFHSLDELSDDLNQLIHLQKERHDRKLNEKDPYVKLARESILHYLTNEKMIDLPNDLPEEMLKTKRGVFVTLHKYGNLRGCIGTFLPTTNSIAEEILRNSIESALSDPRFDPVDLKEMPEIDISVDVLTEPVKASISELDPKKYGVIVTKGNKKGLLLPDLEDIDSVGEQLEIACKKAGINPNSTYEIEKFSVIRHHEGDNL